MSTPHTPKGATKDADSVMRVIVERIGDEPNAVKRLEMLADYLSANGIQPNELSLATLRCASEVAALQAENGELRKEVEASRFHVNQVGQAHEFLDALSVPESEPDAGGGPPVFLSLAERIAYTAMNDDWDEPSKLVHEILSRSSHPAWHDEQREKAEAERDEALRTVGELRLAAAKLEEAAQDAWDALLGAIEWDDHQRKALDEGIEAVRSALGLDETENAIEAAASLASPPPTLEGEG